jgi:hypothetical protein
LEDQASGVLGHGVRDLEWSALYVFEELLAISAEVGRHTDDHLIE